MQHNKRQGTVARTTLIGCLLVSAWVLSACGGGGGGGPTPSVPNNAAGGGTGGTTGGGTGGSTGGTTDGSTGGSTGGTTGGSTGSATGGSTSGGSGSGGSGSPSTGTAAWDYTAVNPSRSGCGSSEGTTYHVGPGQTYAGLANVPWAGLVACDQVLIHYSATPYRNIVYLSARGEANRFITIKGVAGPGGERPIVDGDGAVDPPALGGLNANGGYAQSGLIVIGFSSSNRTPGYLHITGLSFRNARPGFRVSGASADWGAFSPAIFAAPVEQLAVTNCEFANNGLGIFVNSGGDAFAQSRGLLIANNYFHDNGSATLADASRVHHSYTEAIGTVYEYNYFGPLVAGSDGDAVKDRSAGNVFRYNNFAGGHYMISLRDPESNETYESAATDNQGDLLIKHAFIYNNRFVFGSASSVVVGHGDGSFGAHAGNRFGNLFFYGNEVVSLQDWDGLDNHAATLFELLNADTVTTVRAYNNLFYATSATIGGTPSPLALFTWQGLADFRSNWINDFIGHSATGTDGGTAVGTVFDGSGLNGMTEQSGIPGITNLAGGVYTLLNTSPYFSLNAALPTEVTVRGLTPLANTQAVATPFAGPTYGN